MNRKQFGILLVLAVLIGGIGLAYIKKQRAAYSTSSGPSGGKLFAEFPLNEVAQVSIKAPGGEVTLAKQGEIWVVRERSNYPANFSSVGALIRKVWELKPLEEIKVGPSQLGRLELNPPGGAATNDVATLLEFKNKDAKVLASLLLGKKYTRPGQSDNSPFGGGSFPTGRYVQTGGTSKTYLVNDAFSDTDTKPETWVNKDFLRVEKLKSIDVAYPEATNSFVVSRISETADWVLDKAGPDESLDKSKVSGFNYALSSPGFNDVLPSDTPADKTGLNSPVLVNLATLDGFNYALKVGRVEGADNYHLSIAVTADIPSARTPSEDEKPEDKERLDKEFKEKTAKLTEKLQKEQALQQWIYVVSKWTLDSLLKNRHDLLAVEQPASTPTSTPDEEEHDHDHDQAVPPIQLLPKELTNIKVPPLPAVVPSADAPKEVELPANPTADSAAPKPDSVPVDPSKED